MTASSLEDFGFDCPEREEPEPDMDRWEKRRAERTQCTATKGDGEKCTNYAYGHEEKCSIHQTPADEYRCQAETNSGDRCGNRKGYNSEYCSVHQETPDDKRCKAISASSGERCKLHQGYNSELCSTHQDLDEDELELIDDEDKSGDEDGDDA